MLWQVCFGSAQYAMPLRLGGSFGVSHAPRAATHGAIAEDGASAGNQCPYDLTFATMIIHGKRR
jgi:hypothetical protein